MGGIGPHNSGNLEQILLEPRHNYFRNVPKSFQLRNHYGITSAKSDKSHIVGTPLKLISKWRTGSFLRDNTRSDLGFVTRDDDIVAG